MEEPTRVTPTSKSLLDHIVREDCLSNLELGVINSNITDLYVTYVQSDITRSQSIRFQQTRATMSTLRNEYHKEKYLNDQRHFTELPNLEQDVDTLTESMADALTTFVIVFTFKEKIKLAKSKKI